ncbi:alpha/beta hydrolase [Vibrio sp. 10N]|uniref:alpha/beta hydrolase n=1 Tax=Vibrio sp. 10N TaxID=3058938 RepID=UPI0030C72A35
MKNNRLATLLLTCFTAMNFGCNQQGNGEPNLSTEAPLVSAESTYLVLVESDIEYADGLVHDNVSTSPFAAPQTLDIYYPANDHANRPVYMFIHGGGFQSGTKTKPEIIDLAHYFASRGWVVVSVDYRTAEDLGTITGKTPEELLTYYNGIAPQEWLEYALQTAESSDQVKTSTAMYTAQRDAKAALRWIVANADTYNINPDYITVGGASAGSITTIALGISDNEDFRDEISISDDPTLATTHLDQSYVVRSMVYYWGSNIKLDLFENVYGLNRYDSNDPELFMAHGTENDPVTPYSEAVELQDIYNDLGIYNRLETLEGYGHGAWNAQVDGKGLSELSFDFLVNRQNLTVQ